MSHFSHTNVYFIREEEEDSLHEEEDQTYLATAEVNEDDSDSEEMDDEAV